MISPSPSLHHFTRNGWYKRWWKYGGFMIALLKLLAFTNHGPGVVLSSELRLRFSNPKPWGIPTLTLCSWLETIGQCSELVVDWNTCCNRKPLDTSFFTQVTWPTVRILTSEHSQNVPTSWFHVSRAWRCLFFGSEEYLVGLELKSWPHGYSFCNHFMLVKSCWISWRCLPLMGWCFVDFYSQMDMHFTE